MKQLIREELTILNSFVGLLNTEKDIIIMVMVKYQQFAFNMTYRDFFYGIII